MFIGPCIIVIAEEWKTNLMSLAILFHFLCAQHVSDIKRQNTSHQTHTTIHRKFTLTLIHPSLQNKTTDVVIQQHSRKLLKMDILMSETCWALKKWNKIASDIKLVFHSSSHVNFSALPSTDDQFNTFCESMRQKDIQTTGFATQDTAGYIGLLYSKYVMLSGCNFSMEGCNATILSSY